MAETIKKYLDIEGVKVLKTNLETVMDVKDAQVLSDAKSYTESTVEVKVNELANGTVKDNTDAIAKLNGDVETEGSVAKAVADAKAELEGKITSSEYDDTQVKADIKANADAIDAIEADYLKVADKTELEGKITANAEAVEAHRTAIDATVTTLVGEDTGKSVRTIANEELAAQLLSGEADADFQTLQELAAWLENHPEDVATINLNISNLQKLVGILPEDATATDVVGYIAEAVAAEKARAEEVEGGIDERLQAVETKVGDGIGGQVDVKIAELDADITSAAVEEGKGVQVQVVEVDGKITTVAVNGNYDNSYDAKGDAAQALVNAKTYADGLADNYDAAGSATTAEQNAKDYAKEYADGINTAMNTRVEALEAVEFTAISTEEINGLFATAQA